MSTAADILKSKADPAVHTIASTASVFDAVQLMAQKNIGSLVVTQHDRVVGIVTEREIAREAIALARAPRDTPLHLIMTSPVMVVPPQRTSDECMALMTEHRVRHLPVMVDAKLIGIVSIGDLVKHIISDQQFIIEQLERYIAGQRT
jgi:CBS domain-containing protein